MERLAGRTISPGGAGMIATVLRPVGAIAAGLAVAAILVVAVELLSSIVHPVPEDFQGTSEEMCRHVERIPPWVLAVVVVAWGVTAIAGTWTAGRLGNRACALLLGLLLLAAVVLNIAMLPYALWFKVAILIAIPMAIVWGYRSSGHLASATTTVT